MKTRPILLPALLGLLNFALIAVVVAFLYLLFGENVMVEYRKQPVATTGAGYRSGAAGKAAATESDEVVDGIHVATGLVFAEGFDMVRGTCTACHSAKLVTQNRATREGWTEMIRWMQQKQGLWDLGKNEAVILDYLATNYAPEEIGRRANIDVDAIEWYVLEPESK